MNNRQTERKESPICARRKERETEIWWLIQEYKDILRFSDSSVCGVAFCTEARKVDEYIVEQRGRGRGILKDRVQGRQEM